MQQGMFQKHVPAAGLITRILGLYNKQEEKHLYILMILLCLFVFQ